MNSPRIKNEGWLYGLAFLIAIALRFIQLGAAPLTDSEAALALQALHLAQGRDVILAPQPGYILFTSIFFAITESTNFMARVVPALAGSALVFAPYIFRRKIGSQIALILAFLFSFDPGLVALARQSNGTILAATFLLFAWGMWINRRETAAGIFLALALLSGPSVWSGLLTFLLTSIFLRAGQWRPAKDHSTLINDSADEKDQPVPQENNSPNFRDLFLSFIFTFVAAGTLLLTTPNGLSSAFASIPAYFAGWVTPSATTTSRVLFTFLAYEILGISIATLSLIRGFRTNSKRIIRLGMWLGVTLIFGAFYRNTNELVWGIIPLLALAAFELRRAFEMDRDEYMEVGVVAFAIFILLVYIWYNISGLALNPGQPAATVPLFGVVQNPRYFVLYGSAIILVVSIGLVAFGWSARTARLGTTWSFLVFFGLYSLGAAWGASGLRNPGGVELWLADSRPSQAALLRASVSDISEFSVGHDLSQPVTIYGISSPALEWALRENNVTLVTNLDPQVAPPIVITPVMNDLSLPSAYRGQDFTWRQTPQWEIAQDYDWVRWLVFRQLPLQNETILLWARDDLFPDARQNVQP